MKTHFHIENKEFVDFLKLTANGETHYFCDDLTIEFDDCENLDIVIEYVRTEEYFKIKSKNWFLKLLLPIAKWILAPLMFFIDNDDGIRLENGYHSFNPFTHKTTFSIVSPNEKTIGIHYIESKYDEATKTYAPLSIELKGEGVINKNEETTFSSTILKQEWSTYHTPAFTVIMIAILLINILNFSIFAKVIREIPVCSILENIFGIVGMSFCSRVTIALLVACVAIIMKAYRLQREVIRKNI